MSDPAKSATDVEQTSTEIIPANPLRNGIILCNRGDVDVDLGFGEAAVLNEGIVAPAGGIVTLHYGGEPAGYNDIFKKAINGISASGTNKVSYQEL